MADNVQITAGSGTPIRTDEVTIGGNVVHVQGMKLYDGTDGGTDPIPGTAARGLYVDPRPKVSTIQATPTISTSPAYAAKDAIGGLLTFANAARAAGGACRVEALQLLDKGQQMSPIDLLLFDRSITAPADNAAFNPSDLELGYCVGVIPISGGHYADEATNSVASLTVGLEVVLNGTDLYAVAVARSTPTYTSSSDLVWRLTVLQD